MGSKLIDNKIVAIHVDRIVNEFYTSNTYIISDNSDSYIIDCGDAFQIIKWIEENENSILGVFLTHTHFDHIYGLNNLIKKYPNLQIYTSTFGKEALFDSRKNLSFYHEEPFVFYGNNIKVLNSNDEFLLWDKVSMKIFETDGHDKSCLTYFVNNYLFTGDSYIPGIKVIATLPNANKTKANKSEELIKSLILNDTIVCPGHGEICTGDISKPKN